MGRQPCCDKVGLKRGPWTIEEDHKLINFILNNGIQCWRTVPKLAGLLRCGKSCRLRWINYLRPDLKQGAFTKLEEDQIIQLHSRLGNRWSKIASHFPGRTDNEIKNHWNTRIKKKLKLLGLDPITHRPIEPKERTKGEIDNMFADLNLPKERQRFIRYKILQENHTQTLLIVNEMKEDGQDQLSLSINKSCNHVNDYSILIDDMMTYTPSFSVDNSLKNSIGESSSVKQESGNVQQWVDSMDFLISWDGFSQLDDELLFISSVN